SPRRHRYGARLPEILSRRAITAPRSIDNHRARAGDCIHASHSCDAGPGRRSGAEQPGARRIAMVSRGILASSMLLLVIVRAEAGQAPFAANAPDFPVAATDRVYAAEQFSNTVSVINPATNRLLGVIRLGDTQPANLSPLYRGQVLVHGLGFSPDRKTLVVVSIASNAVTFIDTATSTIKHTTYVGRSPHEAFFTPNGREVWVAVRGEDYIAILDTTTYAETGRIGVPNGPGMAMFSPDGAYAYVCSSFTPETVVIAVANRAIIGRVKQVSAFCPNIAAAPN